MKTKDAKPLHNIPTALPGAICVQWVRRGNKCYQCHARFWRENGRLRKQYVRQADVEAVTAASSFVPLVCWLQTPVAAVAWGCASARCCSGACVGKLPAASRVLRTKAAFAPRLCSACGELKNGT